MCTAMLSVSMMADDGDVTMTVSGMTTKMSDGTWSININSSGRVSSLQRATWKPGVNDASVYRSGVNSGRHYLFTTDFPNTGLKAGENTVTLQLSGAGSKDGIMYDCIKMEAGELVIDGIADATIQHAPLLQPTKYLHEGRLVIEKGGQRYTVDGKKIR